MSQLVKNCRECPNRVYYSGGAYHCALTERRILDDKRVSEFCPLPTYPAKEISKLQHSLMLYSVEEAKLGLHAVLIRHIGAKLNIPIDNYSSVTIEVPRQNNSDPTEVRLIVDNIISVDIRSQEICFHYNSSKYRLDVGCEKWGLYKEEDFQGKSSWLCIC